MEHADRIPQPPGDFTLPPPRHPATPLQNCVAISVKQPWAALIVAGLKTIEVRTWPTRRQGRVLIHAGRLPDDRREAWAQITTPELHEAAGLRGGIVGVVEITACRAYETAAAFAADAAAHLNAPEWFAPPRLYGFLLRNARPVPFHPYPGQTMFFGVDGYTPPAPPANGPA